jgi:hypothetical protein
MIKRFFCAVVKVQLSLSLTKYHAMKMYSLFN